MTQVMELVKALTRTVNSITVCATIHSPSPQTFDLFGKVIILLSGRIVYFGNNGGPPAHTHAEVPRSQNDASNCWATLHSRMWQNM